MEAQVEDYTEFHEPALTLSLTLNKYVRLHRALAHYRNFFQRNALSEEDFAVLDEVADLQRNLNNQVNAQLSA